MPALYHRRKKMKTYDVAFAIGTAAALYVLKWDKAAVEALISGLTIGAYVVWRLKK